MHRARTVEEYVDWVRQAIDEVDELRDCLAYELEDAAQLPPFLEPLQNAIRDVYRSMEDGSYRFGDEDLPFMKIANRYMFQIPFMRLLESINETHHKGLDVEED